MYGFKVYGKKGSKYYKKLKQDKKNPNIDIVNENRISSDFGNNNVDHKYVEAVIQKINKLSI